MPARKALTTSPIRVAVAKASPQPGRVLINIGRAGVQPDGDTMDLARADVAAAKDAIAKHRDFVVGIKARLSRDVAAPNDYEVLRRSQEVAERVQSARDDSHGANVRRRSRGCSSCSSLATS